MAEPFLPLPIRSSNSLVPLLQPYQVTKWAHIHKVVKHKYDQSVTHIQFSPIRPYELAVAHDFTISLVNPSDGYRRSRLTNFRDIAYSPNYKKDGRLLVAGCENGSAHVFDVSRRSTLRTFKAHKRSVKTAKFSRDGLRILTGSDDHTVRAWDLGTAQTLFVLDQATDYVQSQTSSPASMHVWMTGSSDRKARIYDLRTQECIYVLDHGSAISDVHILPGGARAVTIGGPDVRVWDFLIGGQVIYNLQPHAKAVTCGAIDIPGNSFLTGGLDHYVKAHDLSNFKSKGQMSFHEQLLSIDVSADGKRYGAGMVDGTLEIRAHEDLIKKDRATSRVNPFDEKDFEGWGRGFEKIGDDKSQPRPGTKRYFNRGIDANPNRDDVLVAQLSKPKLAAYDRSLRKFDFGEALNLAVQTRNPAVVVSVVEELIVRGSLKGALSNRTQKQLMPLLLVIRKNIGTPQYAELLAHLMHSILDLYGKDFGKDGKADRLVGGILSQVSGEVRFCNELNSVKGGIESILCASKFSI